MDLKDYSEGRILLIDKPYTWTSFDVVNKLRYALKIKKIGHAGTLDPLATGLLLIGTGKFTKKLNELQGLDKTYEGIIGIGKTTPSYDLETDFDSESPIEGITESDIRRTAIQLTGNLEQIPPAHSAVRIGGERAYKQARQNIAVKLDPRQVKVHAFEVTRVDFPDVHFRIRCSKGTYIRSIARDFGDLLGVGAYLKSLRRTAIGEYSLTDAENLEAFVQKIKDHADH